MLFVSANSHSTAAPNNAFQGELGANGQQAAQTVPAEQQQQQQQQEPGQAQEAQQQQQQQQQPQGNAGNEDVAQKLMAMEAKLQQLAQESQAKEEALKRVSEEKEQLSKEVGSYKYASSILLSTDDTKVLTDRAKEQAQSRVKEAHAQASELLPVLDDWVRKASPYALREMHNIRENVANFEGVNKKLMDNEAALNGVVAQTRVLHNIKKLTDKQIAEERNKTSSVQTQLQQTQNLLKQEQEKHAKTLNEFARANQRLELLEQHARHGQWGQVPTPQPLNNGMPQPTSRQEAMNQFGLGGGTLIKSTASAKPVPMTPSTPVGEKRSAPQAKLDFKKTTASAGSHSRNVRARFADADDRYGGCWMAPEMTPPVDDPMFAALTQDFAADLRSKGLPTTTRPGIIFE